MRVLVTGATGFVGTALCERLVQHGHTVRAVRRALAPVARQSYESVAVGDLGPETNWNAALSEVQVIVHLAARVHVMRETAADPLAEFRQLNVAATAHLARRAVAAGHVEFRNTAL